MSRPRKDVSVRRGYRKKLAVAVLTYAVLLGGLEGGARLFLGPARGVHRIYDSFFREHDYYVEDVDLFWRLPPGVDADRLGVRLRSNAYGLRDEDFPVTKPEGVFRILSLGESGTFGEGVELPDTYNKQLEGLLNEGRRGGPRYQVINAAQPSYSSFQGLVYLEKEGFKFRPDLVMTYFQTNDELPSYFVVSSSKTDWNSIFDPRMVGPGLTDRELYERRHSLRGSLDRFFQKSVFYQNLAGPALRMRYSLEARRRGAERSGDIEKAGRKKRVPMEDRMWVFDRYMALTGKRGIKLLVLNPPYLWRWGGDNFSWLIRREHVHYIDLAEAFRRQNRPYEDLFQDEVHPNARGHRIIAKTILAYFKKHPEILK